MTRVPSGTSYLVEIGEKIMRWHKILVLFGLCVEFTSNAFGGEERELVITTQELIQGMAARSEAIFSGRMDYRQENGFVSNKKKSPKGEYRVVFSGSSWRLRSKYVASEIPISRVRGSQQVDGAKLEGFTEETNLSTFADKWSVTQRDSPSFSGSLSSHAARPPSRSRG